VSRREAEFLFDLNHRTEEHDNCAAWNDLFVKGVGNYLVFPRQAPDVLSAQEYTQQNNWLAERKGVGEFIASMGQSLKDGGALDEAFNTAASFTADGVTEDEKTAMAALARGLETTADKLAEVDAAEAQWLLGQLPDGVQRENERALMSFVKEMASRIHPSLDPLLQAAGI